MRLTLKGNVPALEETAFGGKRCICRLNRKLPFKGHEQSNSQCFFIKLDDILLYCYVSQQENQLNISKVFLMFCTLSVCFPFHLCLVFASY